MTATKTAKKKIRPMTAQRILALVKSGEFKFGAAEVREVSADMGRWSKYVLAKLPSPWQGDPFHVVIHPLEPSELHWPVKFLVAELGFILPKGRTHTLVLSLGAKVLRFGSLTVDTDDGEVRFEFTDSVPPGANQEERLRYLLNCLPAAVFEAASYVYRIATRTATGGHMNADLVDKQFEVEEDKMQVGPNAGAAPLKQDDDLV